MQEGCWLFLEAPKVPGGSADPKFSGSGLQAQPWHERNPPLCLSRHPPWFHIFFSRSPKYCMLLTQESHRHCEKLTEQIKVHQQHQRYPAKFF
jgi:hypothetical protein